MNKCFKCSCSLSLVSLVFLRLEKGVSEWVWSQAVWKSISPEQLGYKETSETAVSGSIAAEQYAVLSCIFRLQNKQSCVGAKSIYSPCPFLKQ